MKKSALIRTINGIFNSTHHAESTRSKLESILNLCVYFSSEGVPNNIKAELDKIQSQVLYREILDRLIRILDDTHSKELTFHTRFSREEIKLNSNEFNLQSNDDINLISQISQLSSELLKEPIDIVLLMEYLRNKIEPLGYLDIVEEE